MTGYVSPLFEVKKSQQFIEGFRWLEKLRPVRAWYGGRLHWNDELGDVSDELEEYFSQPPLFKVIPKPVRPMSSMPAPVALPSEKQEISVPKNSEPESGLNASNLESHVS